MWVVEIRVSLCGGSWSRGGDVVVVGDVFFGGRERRSKI